MSLSRMSDISTKKGPVSWTGPLFFVWLPDRNAQRTKPPKTLTELIPCYYAYDKKKRLLCKGKKPDFIPLNKILTQKERRSHHNQAKQKNPIFEAYKYLEYFENHPGLSYRDVAQKFNISKTRVSQMIALVKKLPQEILDYLTRQAPENPCYFTERKLRPLTLMESDEAKIQRFRELKDGLP